MRDPPDHKRWAHHGTTRTSRDVQAAYDTAGVFTGIFTELGAGTLSISLKYTLRPSSIAWFDRITAIESAMPDFEVGPRRLPVAAVLEEALQFRVHRDCAALPAPSRPWQ